MIPWADDLLVSAIVASAADGTGEADLRARVETAGGHLAGESLVAAQLRTGNAEAALAECERRLPQLEREGRVRAYWIFEELRIQALLAVDRLHDVCSGVETALSFIAPLGWRSLAWRLQASQVAALDELGDERAATARRTAVGLLTAVAGTLRDRSMRSRFLSQRVAASLLE